ncbi:hypothetical protein HK105_200990 [Polyrhizophydium stewartii]|uniref:Ankyrin repeat protein n=1 Tax=Polyrhizophydium stewartii TaxID=2732419 RepID=A0ABR4NIK8_9FUNG
MGGTVSSPPRRDDGPQSPPLAPGRSHWDRLPPELQGMVLEHNTLFGRFLRGELRRVEIHRLRDEDRRQLWEQALKADWPGNVETLPWISKDSDAFLSRGMLARIRAADRTEALMLYRVALRQGWHDLLDRPELALAAAAREGAVGLLEELAVTRQVAAATPELAVWAARGGQLAAARWVHEHTEGEAWPFAVMQAAAGCGSLELVAWVAEQHPECFGAAAVVDAAAGGHLVDWFVDRGCGEHALDAARQAIQRGHVGVVALLLQAHAQQVEALTAADAARAASPLVLEYLHDRGLLRKRRELLDLLVSSGNGECVRWACETFGFKATQRMLQVAAEKNYVDLAAWLLQQPQIRVRKDEVTAALTNRSLEVFGLFLEHSDESRSLASSKADELMTIPILFWFLEFHPDLITQRTLETAVEMHHVYVFHWLIKSRQSSLDLAKAREFAASKRRESFVAAIDATMMRQAEQPK